LNKKLEKLLKYNIELPRLTLYCDQYNIFNGMSRNQAISNWHHGMSRNQAISPVNLH